MNVQLRWASLKFEGVSLAHGVEVPSTSIFVNPEQGRGGYAAASEQEPIGSRYCGLMVGLGFGLGSGHGTVGSAGDGQGDGETVGVGVGSDGFALGLGTGVGVASTEGDGLG